MNPFAIIGTAVGGLVVGIVGGTVLHHRGIKKKLAGDGTPEAEPRAAYLNKDGGLVYTDLSDTDIDTERVFELRVY